MNGRVLGVVGVEGTGGKGAFGTTKAAALFALLVTSPGCRCSRQEIADALWEGEEGSDDQVNWVVRDLKKRLGKEFLPHAGKSGECVLRLPARSVDYLRFLEDWHGAAKSPLPERFELLRSALEEWKDDEPLKGLAGGGFQVRRERMREERIAAVCDLLEAGWRAKQEQWLREESEKWYARLPRNPRVFQYYLYAHGRGMRKQKIDGLLERWNKNCGMPDRDLQHAIDWARGEVPRSGGAVFLPIPHELPNRRRPIGQEDLIRAVVDYVGEEQDAGRVALVLLGGMAGVGKSTVAYHLAQRLRERFPDGALHAELNGFAEDDTRPADPEEVLDGFLARLPPYSTVTGLAGKSAMLRSALADRSLLLVLDNASSAQQIQPLLPGAEGNCAVIITSRNGLGGLRSDNEVYARTVEPLRNEAALEVLQEKVAEKDRRTYAREFAELARLCGNLPLALTIVARRLEYRRSPRAIPDLVREMKTEWKRLDALHCPEHEMSVRVALHCSVRVLTENARLLLWQLAVHPGPSLLWDAVMDIGSVSEDMIASRSLEELVAANLVMYQDQSGRYLLHDLVRAFARHHLHPAALENDPEFEKKTVLRLLEHQLQSTWACDRVLDRRRVLPIGEPDGDTPAEPVDKQQAMDWLDSEYPTLKRGVELAVKQRFDRYMWLLPMTLVTYQWRRRLLRDAGKDLSWAVEAVERGESSVDRAMVYRMMAGTEWRQEKFSLANSHLRRAVHLSREDDSDSGRRSLALSLYTLGITLRKQGEGMEAEEHLRQALRLYQELSDRAGTAEALNALGALHHDRGEYGEALHLCEDALSTIEQTEQRVSRADVLFTLSKVCLARLEKDKAIALFRQACEDYREEEDGPGEDKARRLFADVLVSAGRTQEAVVELERVLVLREQMKETDPQEIRQLLEGLR
ncbi:tetratricopeptide repeat protein [Streptomyces nitrosporeus]|uniref:tetratricopeptide repeat protein n=1 Tax=Streptomyces nitrosporeus TaxID=28894 RepID=UPI0039A16480